MRIINGKALKTTDYQDQVEPEEEGDRAEQEGLQEGGGPTVEVPAVLCTNVSTFYSLVKIIINFISTFLSILILSTEFKKKNCSYFENLRQD